MTPKDSKVVSITHQGICQHERHKVDTGKKVILCLAPAKSFKGWKVLKKACDQMWNEGEKFELRVYSPVQNPEAYMVVKEDGFTQNDMEQMMNEADLLVAPSIWYETFGFTILEALSYRVPVIVSDHVGAKDVIEDSGVVVESGSVDELKIAMENLDIEVKMVPKSWRQFLNDIYSIYGG